MGDDSAILEILKAAIEPLEISDYTFYEDTLVVLWNTVRKSVEGYVHISNPRFDNGKAIKIAYRFTENFLHIWEDCTVIMEDGTEAKQSIVLPIFNIGLVADLIERLGDWGSSTNILPMSEN